jgi:hypothetical protein
MLCVGLARSMARHRFVETYYVRRFTASDIIQELPDFTTCHTKQRLQIIDF